MVSAVQSIHLIDEEPQAVQIAKFLRHCPGLNKHTIGELLGEHDDFFLEVLDQFTQLFQFQGECWGASCFDVPNAHNRRRSGLCP